MMDGADGREVPQTPIEQALRARLGGYFPEDAPGVAIAVTQNGAIEERVFFGLANLEAGMPWSKDTLYTFYSVTKTIVAVATFAAIEDGLIHLEAPCREYLPDFARYEHEIRIRHLLTHTSGLYNDELLLELVGAPAREAGYDLDDLYELTTRQSRLSWEPGSYFSYSDTALRLLARILVDVTGKNLQDVLNGYVFEPAGMTSAFAAGYETYRMSQKASTYFEQAALPGYDGRVYAVPAHGHGVESSGDGGVIGTIDDLAQFVIFLQSSDATGAPVFERLAQRVPLGYDLLSSYRWSLESRRHAGREFLYHRGLYGKAAGFFPELGLGVAIMQNGMDAIDEFDLLPCVLDCLLDSKKVQPKPEPRRAEIPQSVRDLLEGWYVEEESGFFAHFLREGEHFGGTLVGKEINLVAHADGRVTTDPASATLTAEWAEIDGKLHMRLGDWEGFRALTPANVPYEAERDAFAGTYFSPDFGSVYAVTTTPTGIDLAIGPAIGRASTIHLTQVTERLFITQNTTSPETYTSPTIMSVRVEIDDQSQITLWLCLNGISNFVIERLTDRQPGWLSKSRMGQ